jgi:aminopeptidase C
LWQPDVYQQADQSLPALRILKAFCQEKSSAIRSRGGALSELYMALLAGVEATCDHALGKIESGKSDQSVPKVLGNLRKELFPIIKFFIHHPQNRLDYYRDALNRLNYAVKVTLTQYFGKYTDLQDPYWEITHHAHIKEVSEAAATSEKS